MPKANDKRKAISALRDEAVNLHRRAQDIEWACRIWLANSACQRSQDVAAKFTALDDAYERYQEAELAVENRQPDMLRKVGIQTESMEDEE